MRILADVDQRRIRRGRGRRRFTEYDLVDNSVKLSVHFVAEEGLELRPAGLPALAARAAALGDA